MFKINEIFKSISGETSNNGKPTIFIRLSGCNLKCTYCDTDHREGKLMELSKVVNKVIELGSSEIYDVCITGGEPLLNPLVSTLAYELRNHYYKVQIETNGSVPLIQSPHFKYIMDVKCPSSEYHQTLYKENFRVLKPTDEIKFVIRDKIDFDYAISIVNEYKLEDKSELLFSPMFDEDFNLMHSALGLTEWLIESGIKNWRIQIQLHKILGVR